MKRDSNDRAESIPSNSAPRDGLRRKLLKVTAAGLVAGVAGPILPGASTVSAAENGKRKILIAYYSRTGNTREVASQIQQQAGGELFELRTVHSYPKEYRPTTDQAKREQETGFRPQLTADVANMAAYDTVFVGYPNWWGTFPMAFFTFFEKYDFAGKTLIPFCTHEGSHLGRSVTDMKALCPKARILDGIALRGGNNSTVRSDASRREVAEWLRKLGMIA